MTKIKWGVLGAGGIARRRTIPEGILPAANACLTSLYNPTDTELIAREFNARACASEADLLASDCDVIYIATPVHLHRDQVVRAAKAGKHVFCEKPLGLNVSEAQEMVDICAQAGVRFGVGFLMRFHAQHREALRLIQAGRLGKPVFGRAQLSCWYPPMEGAWRQDPALGGGGSLMDMGCHCIDLLEMFFGRTRRVHCMIDRLVHPYRSEDTAVVLLEFESGARGVVDTMFNIPDSSSLNRLELYGSLGSILTEGTIGQSKSGTAALRTQADGSGGYDAEQSRSGTSIEPIDPKAVNTYRAQIEAFSQCILENTPPPIGGAHGLWNQRVLAACYESARTGSSISL